jgi:hypothetical protein
MQSRRWREEPDMMALDRDGNLYIFELKVWESRQENILQALRYGQINGALDYDGLNAIWQRATGADRTLSEAHQAKFGVTLSPEQFNRRQVFVILHLSKRGDHSADSPFEDVTVTAAEISLL